MSSDRHWDQRRFQIEVSIPIHFHDHFSETFDPLSGSITVFSSDQPHDSEEAWISRATSTTLEPGQKATVQPGQYHKYVAGPEEQLVLRVTIEPGYLDFERLLMILNGLADDGKLGGMGDSVTLMAVTMDLANAHVIWPAKALLDGVAETHGKELAELKAQLLAKYDNKESLKKLMASN